MHYGVAWAPHNLIAMVPRGYAAGLSWTLASEVASMAMKMLVLVVLARVLGPSQPGLFVAAKAMVELIGSLSGWSYGIFRT